MNTTEIINAAIPGLIHRDMAVRMAASDVVRALLADQLAAEAVDSHGVADPRHCALLGVIVGEQLQASIRHATDMRNQDIAVSLPLDPSEVTR